MKTSVIAACLSAVSLVAALAGCAATREGFPVPVGQELTCGGTTYRVLSSGWTHQFSTPEGRVVPNYDFLVVKVEMVAPGPILHPPELQVIDEHYETWPLAPVTARLAGGLRGEPGGGLAGRQVSGLAVFDVPQALYYLEPVGCPRMDLRCWWPEIFGD